MTDQAHTAPPVQISDLTLAVEFLMQTAGGTREQALEVLAADPGFAQRIAPQVNRLRVEHQAKADAAAEAEWRATPEGVMASAREAAAEREKRAQDAALLRAHLQEQHVSEADAIGRLSDDEIFDLAFRDQTS